MNSSLCLDIGDLREAVRSEVTLLVRRVCENKDLAQKWAELLASGKSCSLLCSSISVAPEELLVQTCSFRSGLALEERGNPIYAPTACDLRPVLSALQLQCSCTNQRLRLSDMPRGFHAKSKSQCRRGSKVSGKRGASGYAS